MSDGENKSENLHTHTHRESLLLRINVLNQSIKLLLYD